MRIFVAVVALAALLLPMPAVATEPKSAPRISITPEIGSSGIGGQITATIAPLTEISVGYGSFIYHQQQTFNNAVVDISTNISFVERLQINQVPITLDRRLKAKSPFLISAGLVLNNDHVGASSIPFSSNVTIAGTVYSAATSGQAFADVHFHRYAPYLGLVYAPARGGLSARVGAFLAGKPAVDIYETGAIAANRDKIAKYIDSFNAQLQSALGPISIYPAINVGYRVRI